MLLSVRWVIRPSLHVSVDGELGPLIPVSAEELSRFRRVFRWSMLFYVVGVVAWRAGWRRSEAGSLQLDDLHATALSMAIIGLPIVTAMLAVGVLGDSALRTPANERGYPALYRIRMWWLGRGGAPAGENRETDEADDD